jgi:hypothetical protein
LGFFCSPSFPSSFTCRSVLSFTNNACCFHLVLLAPLQHLCFDLLILTNASMLLSLGDARWAVSHRYRKPWRPPFPPPA